MARIRTVKPEFFTHYELFAAEQEAGLPLRVAFAGLWTQADRDGRFRWIPPQLKLGCLPYDEVDFSRVLDALSTRGFIVKYACKGAEFGVIPSFKEHQVINNREKASSLPGPTPESIEAAKNKGSTREPRVDDALPTPLKHAQAEGKGREGKGREQEKNISAPAEAETPPRDPVDPDPEKQKPKTPKPNAERKVKYTPDDFAMAEVMAESLAEQYPSQKADLPAWADCLRMMREIDGLELADIESLWTWCRHDDFWRTNIRAPTKFRQRKDGATYWDILSAQRQRSIQRVTGSPPGSHSTRDRTLEQDLTDDSWAHYGGDTPPPNHDWVDSYIEGESQ